MDRAPRDTPRCRHVPELEALVEILSYATALAVVAAAPGPVVAILLARALAGQRRGAALFAAGVILAKLATLAAVMSGLVLWIGDPRAIILAAKAMVIAYLGTVVLHLWRSAARGGIAVGAAHGAASWGADLTAGIVAGLASPLSLLFFVALLSAGSTGDRIDWSSLLTVAIVTVAAPGAVYGGYVLLACRLQRLLSTTEHARLVQRAMAALLACTTIWMIAGMATPGL
ncbi:hypothetical protein E4191_03830 [Paracoccus liaowanqingii]|uniref:LysE family translocator n=1 Tax=Paracoccus liaowanqingii TaxID=2560053 RepID=A0A4P7HIL5_9RHOB|nr:hypothetical protein E4191_03830 [Paracoccus liaowanqingii]